MHLSLFQTVSHADRVQGRMHRCFSQSAASTGWIRSPRSTSSSKTRPKALDISSLEFYSLLLSSIYTPVAVVVPKPNRQLPINCTSVNKLIICRCQQPSSVAVNKLFNCRRSLNQFNSNKPSLQKRGQKCSKEIINRLCIFCCVLCVVYHSTVLCQQSNANFVNKIIIFS